MKINFSQIKLIDLEDKTIEGSAIHKTLANLLYARAENLDLVEIARAINKGEEVDLRPEEVKEIQKLVKNPQNGIAAFARKTLLDFIIEKEKTK